MRPKKRWFAFTFLSLTLMGATPMKSEPTTVLYPSQDADIDWWTVNDTVMGGVSRSRWVEPKNAPPYFEGTLSLENNGGFTSVRSGRVTTPPAAHTGVKVTVLGDGRTYKFVLRSQRVGRGVSYQAEFQTTPNESTTVYLPFERFTPRWRGMEVQGAPTLTPRDIASIGFLLADKKPGPFKLAVIEVATLAKSGPSPAY